MRYPIRYVLTVFLFAGFLELAGQDIIIRTNGAQINAKVIEVTADSVLYKNKNMEGNPVFSIPRSDVKVIEYWSGKKDYLQGSYANISGRDSSSVITGVKSKKSEVLVEGIAFHVERLFTEYHLILDYTHHPDTNFTATKGKIEFDFAEFRNNFFVRYFPTGVKTAFAKFVISEEGENKRYGQLSNKLLNGMVIYYDDSVSMLVLDSISAQEMREMFSGKDIRYEP